jgi:hypothetical protein
LPSRVEVKRGEHLSWLDRFRKVRISPEALARSLFDVFVGDGSAEQLAERDRVPVGLQPRFDQKIELYHEALVLMVLIAHSEKKRGFERVLQAYEAIILGPSPTASGLEKLQNVKAAMADLNAILKDEARGHELGWSMAWFQEIGHRETNPVVLSLFAGFWMDRYIAAVKSVREFTPT